MRVCLPLLLALLPLTATAQVVNIENKRFEDDTSRWAAHASLRFNVVENTQRSTELGANGGLQFIHGIHRAFVITDFNLNKVEDNAFTNTGFQHLRYQRAWRGPVHWEAYTQLQYNKPLRIDVRWVTGAGPRIVVRNTDAMRLALGSSLMFEHEVDRVNELRYNDLRLSHYLSTSFKLEPHTQFTAILYYQPLIGDISDHRVALEAQLRFRVTRRWAFDTRLNLQQDTKMAPGVPGLNYRWTNAFTFLW
ncbi:MAG: DUF481 domain-containing protein [Flavobacteriales bacterium]|nr:DUF481 domain-containing protein [Flavobacteriales bacterium]